MAERLVTGTEGERSAFGTSGRTRARRLPMGLLVVPFLIGTLLIVAVGWVMERRVTLGWMAVGFVIGAMFSVLTMVSASRFRDSPVRARVAGASGGGDRKDRKSDPLGHIQAHEAEHRRYRRPCLNCGEPVALSRSECPACGHTQVHACKKCGTQIRLEWDHCPECGTSFHA